MPKARWTAVLFATVACGGSPPPAPAPRGPPAPAAGQAVDAGPGCATVALLQELPTTPPETSCSRRADAEAPVTKEPIATELAALAAANESTFLARRDALVRRGKQALGRLHELERDAPTARARALASALVTRIEQPAAAKQLDTWAPSPAALRLRNPFPAVAKALEAAFAPHPELAFEALASRRELPADRGVLFQVVARGPEAFERLLDLAPRFPSAFPALVALDARRGTCAALAWLDGKLPEPGDETGRGVLATLDSDDPLATHLLRKALRDGSPELKLAAAQALARRKDASVVGDLLTGLGDKRLLGSFREALAAILGADEAERKIAALARECRPELRVGAAMALRFGPSEASSELLAELASDRDARVRTDALDSLAWLALTSREVKRPFGDAVESAVLAATSDPEASVRAPALNALWRLVVEKRRPLSDAMRSAWARALSDPDRRARSMALVELDDFFPQDHELILVVLGDLERVPDEWPHRDALAGARAKLGPLKRDDVTAIARSAVPEVRALAEAWLAKQK